MCGRYASTRSPQELAPLFHVPDVPAKETLAPNWNVAPTNDVWAVLERAPRDDKEDIAAAKRDCGRCAGVWFRRGRKTRRSAPG